MLTGARSLAGHELDHDLGLNEQEGGCGVKPEVSLTWTDDWHFRTD